MASGGNRATTDAVGRLQDVITDTLPRLADLHVELSGEVPDRIPAEIAEIAKALKAALNHRPRPRPWLQQRCVCGHSRYFHSDALDPAEPCTHGAEDGAECPCTRFRRGPPDEKGRTA